MYYKSVLIKVAIFTLGGAVGFLVAKKVYEGYYAAIAQEEIESVKETFANYKSIKPDRSNGMTNEEYAKTQEKRNNNNPLAHSSLEGNPYEQAKKNYNLAGIKHEEPDEEDEERDEPVTDAAGKTEEEMDLSKVDRTQPYIIDDREFSEEFEHHDKISLYYYRVDDVLCDEHEEIINDIEEKVGYEALSTLDMQTTVWVRNEPLCIDYEIISINKSFAESVHGIGIEPNLSPREKYLRQEKRRERREE